MNHPTNVTSSFPVNPAQSWHTGHHYRFLPAISFRITLVPDTKTLLAMPPIHDNALLPSTPCPSCEACPSGKVVTILRSTIPAFISLCSVSSRSPSASPPAHPSPPQTDSAEPDTTTPPDKYSQHLPPPTGPSTAPQSPSCSYSPSQQTSPRRHHSADQAPISPAAHPTSPACRSCNPSAHAVQPRQSASDPDCLTHHLPSTTDAAYPAFDSRPLHRLRILHPQPQRAA